MPSVGPSVGFAQGQSNNQGLKDNDMGVFQGCGVGRGHPPKPKTKNRGRGRGRGSKVKTPDEGFQDVDQVFHGDNQSQFFQGQRYSEEGACQQYQGMSNPAIDSTFDDSPRSPFVGEDPSKRGQENSGRPCDNGNRGRGWDRMRHAQSLSSLTEIGDQRASRAGAKEQSRFQQNQLLVSGLSALTTKDCLVNFIEAMSGGEVEDVMQRKDKALITMASDITGKLS